MHKRLRYRRQLLSWGMKGPGPLGQGRRGPQMEETFRLSHRVCSVTNTNSPRPQVKGGLPLTLYENHGSCPLLNACLGPASGRNVLYILSPLILTVTWERNVGFLILQMGKWRLSEIYINCPMPYSYYGAGGASSMFCVSLTP